MTTKNYERHNCPIAKTLAAVGDQWTLMIVRDAFRGRRRFEEFQASLEVSRNLLTSRLKRMVEDGLLERYLIDGSKRHGYRPTENAWRSGRHCWRWRNGAKIGTPIRPAAGC